MPVIACYIVDMQSISMADRNELVECRLEGGEEGILGWECMGSGESKLLTGTVYWTILQSPTWISPLEEILK